MRFVADFIYLLAGIAYLPVLLYQAVVLGKNRSGWGERSGFVTELNPAPRRIWIHGVSLGEINATPRLVERLSARIPDAEFVFSTTTDTGYARAVQLYGRDRVFRFPLDFSFVVNRVLRRVQPALIVLVELEVWYNLLRSATRRGIPVAVVNGRLNERSAGRLRRLGQPARTMFSRLRWVGAQDTDIADRFRQLGVTHDRLQVTSSLKWDSAAVTDRIDGADALAAEVGMDSARKVWVCGSTGPGEEAMILQAYTQWLNAPPTGENRSLLGKEGGKKSVPSGDEFVAPLLVIVPRKPERFDEVARLIARAGFSCVRRSECREGSTRDTVGVKTIILGDTMGELRKFYSLADVVFVGRTLVPMGGSDPMEVAAMQKPMVVGPHTENFQLPIDALRRADALRVIASPDALASTIAEILSDKPLAERLAVRAREVVVANQGATDRTVNALADLLDG